MLNLITDFEHGLKKGKKANLDERSYLSIVSFYEDENQLGKALEVLGRAITQYQYNSDFLKEKSRLLLKLRRFEEAHVALNRAEILAPFKVDILLLRASILAVQNKFDYAYDIIDDVKSYAKKDEKVAVLITEALVAEMAADYELMFKVLKRALILNPQNEEALLLMRSAINQTKHYEESILIHRFIIENHPYTALAWYNLGHSFASLPRPEYEAAIDALEYAFLVDEEFEDAYYDCAEFCMGENEYLRAEIILAEAIAKFEINYDALYNISICRYELGKIEEAKRSLFEAMQLEPYCEELYFLLAKCYIKDQDWVGAIKTLESAIDLEDQIDEYYYYLAKMYERIDKMAKANTFYRKAAFVGEEQSFYWEEYIMFLLRRGNLNVAEKYIKISAIHTYSSKIAYLDIASKLLRGERSAGLQLLTELIQEEFEGNDILLNVDESIKKDKDVLSIINYYGKENN